MLLVIKLLLIVEEGVIEWISPAAKGKVLLTSARPLGIYFLSMWRLHNVDLLLIRITEQLARVEEGEWLVKVLSSISTRASPSASSSSLTSSKAQSVLILGPFMLV